MSMQIDYQAGTIEKDGVPSGQTIVTNIAELEAAIARQDKNIFIKSGATYNLSATIIPYSGLYLKGEKLPSDAANSHSDGVKLYADAAPVIQNITNVAIDPLNNPLSSVSRGDSSIQLVGNITNEIPAGSLMYIQEGAFGTTHIVVEDAAAAQDIVKFDPPLSRDLTASASIYFYPVNVNDIIIENIHFDSGSSSSFGLTLYNSTNITINNCSHMPDALDNLVSLTKCINIKAIDNHISNWDTGSLEFVSCTNVRAVGSNKTYTSASHKGIHIDGGCNVSVRDFRGTYAELSKCDNFIVENCHSLLTDSTFYITECNYFTIKDCSTEFSSYGFYIQNCSNFSITGCAAPNAVGNEIKIEGTNTNYHIYGNRWNDELWLTVSNIGELESALKAQKKHIYMKNGAYDLSFNNLVLPVYSGLHLKGEAVPSDPGTSTDGVNLTIGANGLNYVVTPTTISGELSHTAVSRGDTQIIYTAGIPTSTTIEAGSFIEWDSYLYEVSNTATESAGAITIDLEEAIVRNATSVTTFYVYAKSQQLHNVTFENFSLNPSGFAIYATKGLTIKNVSGGDTGGWIDIYRCKNIDSFNYVGGDSYGGIEYSCNIKVENQSGRYGVGGAHRLQYSHNASVSTGTSNEPEASNCYNFVVANCHPKKAENFRLGFSHYFSVINCTTDNVTTGFDCGSSSNFTITGCAAPNAATKVDLTGATAYHIFGNHWNQDYHYAGTTIVPKQDSNVIQIDDSADLINEAFYINITQSGSTAATGSNVININLDGTNTNPATGNFLYGTNSTTLMSYINAAGKAYFATGIIINGQGSTNGALSLGTTGPAKIYEETNGDLTFSDDNMNPATATLSQLYIPSANVTATTYQSVNRQVVHCDVSSNAITVYLPATPVIGDHVEVWHSAGTLGTNNITIGDGTDTIRSTANQTITMSTPEYQKTILRYIDATIGWDYYQV